MEKLGKIQEEINETYSLSKRSKKLIRHFQKTMMTDKLLCTCIVLICILIIVIIALKIAGFKGDSFNNVF